MKRLALLLISMALGSALVQGQAGPSIQSNNPECWEICQALPDPPMAPSDGPCPRHQEEMDRERRMLEALRITRMTEVLRLSDEQIAKFIPRLKQIEERQRQLRQERSQRIQRLAESLERKIPEKDLRAQLDTLEKLEREEMPKIRQMMQGLDSLLNLEQRVRWRVFNERFGEEIREMVRDIHRKRMERRPPKDW